MECFLDSVTSPTLQVCIHLVQGMSFSNKALSVIEDLEVNLIYAYAIYWFHKTKVYWYM